MIQEITITLYSATAVEKIDENLIRKSAAKQLGCSVKEINEMVLKKKSLDARHGKTKFHLRYIVFTGKDKPNYDTSLKLLPKYYNADPQKRVIIVGSGPAGLFAALKLLEKGITPIIIERGRCTTERKRIIAEISRNHTVDRDTNYCFGEGGAGTFSDGKLYTRSTKRGNPARVYQILNYFGAQSSILSDAHPHIGTDILPSVIQNITAKICQLGGQVLFGYRCTEFLFSKEGFEQSPGGKQICGVVAVNTATGEKIQFYGQGVILATGHSATEIYSILAEIAPQALEAKPFAMGVRVEHPRRIIDNIQYHGRQKKANLPAAEYRLVTQVENRGVYSFCMCPGGLVVPSASSNEELVVNGMSPSSRSTRWSNAAIVVEVLPEDVEDIIVEPKAMAGLFFRTKLEQMAKEQGKGQAAPAQRLTDFLVAKESITLPETSFTPGLVSSRLDLWLPKHISQRLKVAFYEFDKKMRGFITEHAVLIAPETRTSTPVRILRNKETMECIGIKNLYPAGEGSGYSGGIVSSAIDGEKVAEAIIAKFWQNEC
ncbi:MAG: FAD-dependent monooxygenase [Spirochaetaceae bacterium]|nr:FAD-dependent monooxygenase [Spirochaetaceae bacterium]